MSHKDFGGWAAYKLRLEQSNSSKHFRARQVWWVRLGHNIGSEEDGKGSGFVRPVIVIKQFNQHLFYGVPLSTTPKSGPYYFALTAGGITTSALLSQMRVLDAKRLVSLVDDIDIKTFNDLTSKIRATLY